MFERCEKFGEESCFLDTDHDGQCVSFETSLRKPCPKCGLSFRFFLDGKRTCFKCGSPLPLPGEGPDGHKICPVCKGSGGEPGTEPPFALYCHQCGGEGAVTLRGRPDDELEGREGTQDDRRRNP